MVLHKGKIPGRMAGPIFSRSGFHFEKNYRLIISGCREQLDKSGIVSV